MKKTIFTVVIVILVFSSLTLTAAAEKIRVTVKNANIRSQPGLDAKIVFKADKGDIFEVMGRSGDWFRITLPTEADSAEGYISEAVVEMLAAGEIATANKVAKTTPRRHVGTKYVAPKKLFSGLAFKLGLMTTPAARFGNRLLPAVTYEKGINPFLAAGLEFQPYFRSFSDTGFSSSTFGTNLFLNAKGGANIGRFVESLKFLTPYAGFGLGGAFAASSFKADGEKTSSTNFRFAWHMLFGIEFALKKLDLIFEIQILKISVPETDPDPTQYFMMFGVRF